MVRSHGFGSNETDYNNAQLGLGFPAAPAFTTLTLPVTLTRRLILQQARYHTNNRALTACRRTVSVSISLGFTPFFSPFRHRTGSLSVISSI
jgi:hypothetical protein